MKLTLDIWLGDAHEPSRVLELLALAKELERDYEDEEYNRPLSPKQSILTPAVTTAQAETLYKNFVNTLAADVKAEVKLAPPPADDVGAMQATAYANYGVIDHDSDAVFCPNPLAAAIEEQRSSIATEIADIERQAGDAPPMAYADEAAEIQRAIAAGPIPTAPEADAGEVPLKPKRKRRTNAEIAAEKLGAPSLPELPPAHPAQQLDGGITPLKPHEQTAEQLGMNLPGKAPEWLQQGVVTGQTVQVSLLGSAHPDAKFTAPLAATVTPQQPAMPARPADMPPTLPLTAKVVPPAPAGEGGIFTIEQAKDFIRSRADLGQHFFNVVAKPYAANNWSSIESVPAIHRNWAVYAVAKAANGEA